jgi:hypothetical protein
VPILALVKKKRTSVAYFLVEVQFQKYRIIAIVGKADEYWCFSTNERTQCVGNDSWFVDGFSLNVIGIFDQAVSQKVPK